MAAIANRLTKQRSFLIMSFVIAAFLEQLLHSVLVVTILGNQLTPSKALLLIGKYAFSIIVGDWVYGRIVLSVFVLYFLPELTVLRRTVLLTTYLGAAFVAAAGCALFNAQYGVMFVGGNFWLKPIFFQFLAWVIVGLVWSSFCARSVLQDRPPEPSHSR